MHRLWQWRRRSTNAERSWLQTDPYSAPCSALFLTHVGFKDQDALKLRTKPNVQSLIQGRGPIPKI